VPVYVWTAPGPDVRGGLAYILSGGSGPAFIQSKRRWLVTAHSTFLAAEVAVAGARGKARSVLGDPKLSRFLPGVSAALSRRLAAGRMCPVRLRGAMRPRPVITARRV
jgi:hypothetical protein